MRRLDDVRREHGTLAYEDDAHYRRCDNLVKKLKGIRRRGRRESEGVDDINTYSVLAREGFLPGYGLDTGSVVGMAEVPYWHIGSMDFDLPRPSSVALREYVPGNLIYANGHKFVARRLHHEIDAEHSDMPIFEVNSEREAISPTAAGAAVGSLGSDTLVAMPVCDVDLVHQSQISDEEEFRFQMSVAIFGYELGRHNGGVNWAWGETRLTTRRGVHFRLVNVGASSLVRQDEPQLGYPICSVCGQSVSPLSSERQQVHFEDSHEERCGKKPQPTGLYADTVADCLTLPSVADKTQAYSVLEAIRMAAASVLDMHLEDLQILVTGYVDRDEVAAHLWDPMPGGSGLLDQIRQNFDRIIAAATELLAGCPSACDHSCVDCLQTFRNGFYHKYLDRHVALEWIQERGGELREENPIPPSQPQQTGETPDHQPVNNAETKLKHLLRAAGFMSGTFQQQIRFRHTITLSHQIGSSTRDVYYEGDEDDDSDNGICIYLDGLSDHYHGNPRTAEKDGIIRSWLRNNHYDVIPITAVELDDRNAMVGHFKKLARYLEGKSLARQIEEDASWYSDAISDVGGELPFRRVEPQPEEHYRTCVPLVPLQAAAGSFGDPAGDLSLDAEWVEVDSGHALKQGMFVSQVVGKSMAPQIPDGAYCLFQGPVGGTREGKTILVRLRDEVDPETGERFTVKRYSSEKESSEDGTWRHTRITLSPINSQFEPIVLTDNDEDRFDVVAELIEVLG